jgi:hypothetical protein
MGRPRADFLTHPCVFSLPVLRSPGLEKRISEEFLLTAAENFLTILAVRKASSQTGFRRRRRAGQVAEASSSATTRCT